MTNAELNIKLHLALDEFRKHVPYDTHNMQNHGTQLEPIGEGVWRIFMDEKEAPYVFFTVEKWIRRGGTNPNEGWFDKEALALIEWLRVELNAKSVKKLK